MKTFQDFLERVANGKESLNPEDAWDAGHTAGHAEATQEIKMLREALGVIRNSVGNVPSRVNAQCKWLSEIATAALEGVPK